MTTPLEEFQRLRAEMDKTLRASVGPVPPGYTVTVYPLTKAIFGHNGKYWYGHIVDGKEVVEECGGDH